MKRLLALAALCTVGISPTSHALGLERPELGGKESLGVCPTKQDQTGCSLLGLKGPVKHVITMQQDFENQIDTEYFFDKVGKLAQTAKHMRDMAGGTTKTNYSYDEQGRLIGTVSDWYRVQYTYAGEQLTRKSAGSSTEIFERVQTTNGSTKLKVRNESGKEAEVVFDGEGRILSGSKDYARVYEVNPEGPFQCSYEKLPAGSIRATCSGGIDLVTEYGPDKSLRLLVQGTYRHVFTYPEVDAHGNWLVRVDSANPKDKLVRKIEYWD